VETHEVRTTKRGGPLQRDHRSVQSSQTETSIGGVFEGPARILAPSVDLTNIKATDLLEIEASDTLFRPGTTIKKHSRHEHKSDLVWTQGYGSGSESLTYDPLDLTNMRVNRGNVVVEYGAQQNLILLREQVGDGARFVRLYDQQHSYYDDYSSPGALTNAVVALGVNCLIPGGGTVWAQMGYAALGTGVSQGIMTGTIDPTDLLISAASAGAFYGISSHSDYLKAANGASTKTFGQQIAIHMTKSVTNGVVGGAFGRPIKVYDIAMNGAIGAVGAWGANNIGSWYFDGDVSSAAHKGLHFGLGFGMGAVMDPDHWVESGVSAGTAATVAEMMAEITMGDIKAIREGRGNPSKTGSFLSQAVGTIAGSLMAQGANPMIAMMAARNAVENNYNTMALRYYDEEILDASDEAYARTGELAEEGYQYLYDMVVNNELAQTTHIPGSQWFKAGLAGFSYDDFELPELRHMPMEKAYKGPPTMVSDVLGVVVPPTLGWAFLEAGMLGGIKLWRRGRVATEAIGESGGLNLFKWEEEGRISVSSGWKQGDYVLYLPDRILPKLNWKQNSGRLRSEMRKGKPIYDLHRHSTTGIQEETTGFLNAERKLLEAREWVYNPKKGAYFPQGL